MLPFPIVYGARYQLDLGAHVFPGQKYRLIHDRLVEKGWAEETDFVEPREASDGDVMLVHTPGWVRKLRTGTLTHSDVLKLELPFSEELRRAFWLSAGGSILASERALEAGAAMNLCGGFHHAYPDHGEGFCMIHDVAIAIRRMQKDGRIRRALVVDVDVHHGNGTAAIFAGDRDVFTLSIHQYNNYPIPKPPSTLDINLEDGVGDDEYLSRLKSGVETAFDAMTPDLLCYVAGADPYREDQLGGLALTIAGLRARDELVFRMARERGVPVMATLAGGYARQVEDTVTIHTNTVLALKESGLTYARAV